MHTFSVYNRIRNDIGPFFFSMRYQVIYGPINFFCIFISSRRVYVAFLLLAWLLLITLWGEFPVKYQVKEKKSLASGLVIHCLYQSLFSSLMEFL